MLTKESKILIKKCLGIKKVRGDTIEFSNKKWSKRGVEDFLKRLRSTRSIERAPGIVDVVNHAIDEWRRRLSACVDAEGRNFEHYL